MKKVTAIIVAVFLAIVIAMGDEIIKFSMSGNPLGINSIKTMLGLGDNGSINIAVKPKIPTITSIKPAEVDLTYDDHIKKGDYYYGKGFFTLAANEYVKAADLEPTRSLPYFDLLKTNFELEDYSRAKSNADKVLEITPDDSETRYYLVKIYIKQSDFDSANKLIDQLQTGGSTDSRLSYLKALLDIASGKHDDAKKILNTLVDDTTVDNTTKANIQKIMAAYQEFDFAKSAEDLYLSELLSRTFTQIGEYELAINNLKQILKTRPDLRDSWILLGFSYLNLHNDLFALTSFEHAYELDSEWPATQYFLGVTYAEMGKYEDAIIYLNYALNNGFEPSAVVKQKLADMYLNAGKYSDSVKLYEDILQTNKQDVNAFVRPIWIYLEFLSQPEKAMKLAEMAVITFPDEAMAYNLLGWSQTGTLNYIEAEKNLNKAISIDPTLPAPYYNLAKMYEDQKNIKDALTNYQKAYELDQNGSIGNLAAKRYNALLIK
jgi:tetratricopeptide (TPR) repeat protein